jgi:hypothetical protein
MTEPSAPRPGPGRPVPAPAAPPAGPADDATSQDRFADLDGRPVAEHVEVFETEHDRLQSELGTIDRV